MDPAQAASEGTSAQPPPDSPPPGDGNDESQLPKKATVRKRTKTGCLTCRKRRIKCDEAKPTCSNCIKSKRHCEGYSQRLTFKEPLNAYQHAAIFGHHPVTFGPPATEMVQVPLPQPPPMPQKVSSPPGPLPHIAPKPPSVDFGSALPFQPFPGQSGLPLPGQSPSAFSPQQQINQRSYLLSPETAVPASRPQFSPQDFFNVAPPAHVDNTNTNAMLGQISPVSDHWQLQGSRQGSLLTPVEEKMHLVNPNEEGIEYWHSDDEASMVDSDDDEDFDDGLVTANLESNDLGIQVARRMPGPMNTDLHGTRMRTFTSVVDESILETYYPSSTNSPLNDAQTAAIFWYFCNVTAPIMSLYERQPFDSSPIFQGQPVPKTNQHIWTYTFPIVSFNHPGLLQAILAIGSLQMAKLKGIPPTASMKHYHLSLRRLAKNYQSTHRRTQPATLAATLILGFYEVWNADHDKWCKHMWGARAIIKEIPLRHMTRQILLLKRKRRQSMQELRMQQQQSGLPYQQLDEPDIDSVDTVLMSQLTGLNVSYDDFGHVYGSKKSHRMYTDRDIETFENLSDLFWWFCKMDVYQSVLGGSKLFMEYDLWTQCMPRAPMGRLDALYGTFDHLVLLLGRTMNFAACDMSRKRKAKKAGPPGPGGPPGQGQSPPMFPGLVPAKPHVAIPTGFSPPRDPSPPLSDTMEDHDIEASTVAAIQEWEKIRHAYEVFRAHLGPDFDPLGPDIAFPEETPFGPSKTFRTYSIAGIWMNYYMGLIALYRAHPSMPPIAMVAAGMSAKQTMPWALEIGCIAAGIQEDLSGMPALSTSQGAVLIESTLCQFVAAIQYQAEAQRHWMIRRMHDINRLTGWQSARQIADGCESAWTKAAQMGRGPPYQRPIDVEQKYPPSVWANPRRIDHLIQDGYSRVMIAKTERAHYALGILAVEQDLEKLVIQEEA